MDRPARYLDPAWLKSLLAGDAPPLREDQDPPGLAALQDRFLLTDHDPIP
jgi:hypothetical protein